MTIVAAGPPKVRSHATGAVRRHPSLVAHLLLAVAVYLPLIVTQRGEVAADSKQLLFVDASKYLSRVSWLWDPNVGLGTVTHQNVGYLFPVGPFFWVFAQLGVPVWLTQRLWLGTILFGAGAGVLFLARTLRWVGPGPVVAAFAYALTPFTLQYATHLSVLLLPYAVLPWLIGYTIRALRAGGWRWPAWFAIAVALAGSINATALACVLLGPLIVLITALIVTRDTRRVLATTGRIVLLSAAVSLWWAIGLLIEGAYGVSVLDFSESLETVTIASSAPELLRGLGYWFFYGRDGTGPYLDASRGYMLNVLLPLSFVPMLAGVAAAWFVRWRARGMLVAMLVGATVLAVGAHPYTHPSVFGRVFKSVLESVEAAGALRSITRVTPLIVLALAMFLGAGVTAVAARTTITTARVVAGVAVLAVLVAAFPLFQGKAVSSTRVRPQALPQYWRDAVERGSGSGSGTASTRTLEIPGIDFAAYNWGYAHDSITPGLTDRPTVAREVVAWGGEAAIDLMQAYDGRIQNRVFDDADSLAPFARFISAGDVLWRGDLQTTRYLLPSPEDVRVVLDSDEDLPQSAKEFGNPVAVLQYPISDARKLERAEPVSGALIVSGSGDGLVDLAELDQLPVGLVVYSGTLANQPKTERKLLRAGASLVVTDSNRKRASRTKTLFGNDGYTERVGETPLRTDTEDSRLDLFPEAGDDTYSVTVVDGATARATSYGNPVWLVPADRPMLAIDGDPTTAWRTGDFWRVKGERIEVDAHERVRTNEVTLLQAPGGNRTITRVRLTLDGGDAIDVDLGPQSREAPGQTFTFGDRTFRTLAVEILGTDPRDQKNNGGLDGVGFAEITIPGVEPAVEYVRTPTDLTDRIGAASADFPLTYVLSRMRQAALPAAETPTATDAAELRLARIIDVPTTRQFQLEGIAEVHRGQESRPELFVCHNDFLSIDGRPVPVRLVVDDSDEDAPLGRRVLATCDGTPITLTAGTHRIVTTDGRTTGVDINRLTLASAPGGGATSSAAAILGRATAARGAGDAPKVTVVDRGRTKTALRVAGANAPFWLVLGQSQNAGWRATVDGKDLGESTLVDGYANGWYVDPARANFTVTLEWTPQKWVWVGLGLSSLALLACFVLVFRGRRALGLVTATPAWHSPLADRPVSRSTGRVVAAAGGAFVFAAFFVGPVAAIVAAGAAVAVMRLSRGRGVLAGASLLLLGGAVAYITITQKIEHYANDFPWPGSFDAAHGAALVGIVLLAIDAVLHRERDE